MRVVFCLFFYFYYILSKLIVTKKPDNKSSKNILYLAAFFPENAGYHWRVKKWAEELEKEGYHVTIQSVISKEEFYDLLENNFNIFLIKVLHRRFWQVVKSSNYQTVIVRRELLLYNDYGNLFLEKLLLKIHPNAILDFDDDISASKEQPKKISNWFGILMQEDGDKFNNSLKLYKNFIVASNYLKNKVEIVNNNSQVNILVVPTCIDYDKYPVKVYPNKIEKFTLGWIGGDHNYFLLDLVTPVLNELSAVYPFKLIIIGGSIYDKKANFEVEFKKWNLGTEVNDLMEIDIGIMPLNNDEISKGKGGLKLIQYMGLGIVSVASPITINSEIVDDGENSFLAKNDDEWKRVLIKLFTNGVNFTDIGLKARRTIAENYTFTSNRLKYINFVKEISFKTISKL